MMEEALGVVALETRPFAFKALDSLPIPSAEEVESTTQIDLTECDCNATSGLENLAKYRRLDTLIVDKNRLTSIEKLPEIESLQTFWCNNNEIGM